ncbi:hypothetical protein SCLCIDRAFT_1215200 [Scleroderma citrinum Foug A]|uniref:Uncharacterized protein n=1 Tax=Scleroderma citrinum Foug A TaxID=1036808 RepID=A0A0C3ABN9_9AGAM|nr:hypothetical protein SCLCIDRAFT_1215200 [Scleroderma citrinum Foug A]
MHQRWSLMKLPGSILSIPSTGLDGTGTLSGVWVLSTFQSLSVVREEGKLFLI